MNNQTNKPLYKNRRSAFDYYFVYLITRGCILSKLSIEFLYKCKFDLMTIEFDRELTTQVKRFFIKIFYHIRYKYYRCCNLVKNFRSYRWVGLKTILRRWLLCGSETERLKIINDIDRLRNRD